MSNIANLRETRSNLINEARAELAKITTDMSEGDVAEYEGRFDAAMAEADKIEGRIAREERLLAAEAALEARVEQRAEKARTGRGDAEKAVNLEDGAFRSWLRGGMAALSDEQRNYVLTTQAEARAQSIGTPAEGGFLVPEGFRAVLEQSLKAFGGTRLVSTILPTASGNNLPMPTVDETNSIGAIISENSQVSEGDVAFGQVVLGAHMYSSKMIRVSQQLLQDSAFDLPAYLADALGTRLARITNQHFTTGTGTNQPKGIVTAATQGVVGAAGTATSVTYDNLIDLIHSVDPAYRAGATFMFSDNVLKALRKLKDGEGRPLWQPALTAGEPATILGRPYVINNDMPVMAANAKSIVFGDLKKHIIRDVLGVQVVTLNERFADYGQKAFLAFSRHDANCVNPSAIKYFANGAS
jgi:HK97 family phage major capsid protein